MGETSSGNHLSTTRLILVPAAITLGVTLLRLVGELQHWPKPWFVTSAGGGGAIIGIAWLPLIFGPYFAIKLAGAGEGPGSSVKSIGFALLGFVLFFLGVFLLFNQKLQFPGKQWVAIVLTLAGAGIQFVPWSAFAKTLLAYGYAARIPVAIVMFFAIQSNWGTHYDAVTPDYSGPTSLWGKYFEIGLVPQLVGWVAYTIAVGSFFGNIVAAIVRRGKPALQTAT